jgi:anti-anti-sigma factor
MTWGTSSGRHLGLTWTARRAPSRLSVEVREDQALVHLALEGELDIYTTPSFRAHVRRYDPARVQLVIDVAAIGLIDSAGLGALVGVRNQAHRVGGRLGIVCPEGPLAHVFEAAGLRSAFVFGDDLPAVRAALEAPATGSTC